MFEPGKRESKRQPSAIEADVFSVGTASDKRNITASPQRGLATVAVSLAVVGIALVGTLAISRLIVSLAQEPLRPALSQQQAPTPHNQQVNRQAAPDTTPRTILEQVVSAVTNNPLVAGIAHVGETFQNIYDNDSGERTIAVNDGGISFDITTKAKYLYIDLKEDGTYFKVQDNGLDVFRVDYDKNVIVHQGATLHLLGKLKDNTGSLGEAGQVLTAPGGSGSPSWEDAGGLTVGGLNCNNCIDQDEIKDVYVLNTGDSLSGDLTLNGQKALRFSDSDSSNYVSFRGPATVLSNVTWTLPSTDGAASTLLSTDGSGTLSWATAAAGGGSLDAAYNDSTATITVDAYDILFDLNDSTNDYGLVIDNNTSGVIAIGLEFTSGGGGVLTTALEVSASLITNAINVGPNTILGTTAVIDFNNFDVAGSGAITLSPSSALTTAIDVTDTDITNAIDIGTNILAISTGTIGSNAATVIDFLDFDVSADGLIVLAPDGGGDAITVTPSAALTDGLDVANSIITNALNVGPNTIVGTTAVIDFTNFDVSAAGITTTKSLVSNFVVLPGGNIAAGHTVNSNYLNLNGGLGTGGLERLTSTGNLTNISAITAGHLALSTAGDSFTRGADEAVGFNPQDLTAADFNGDGYPDLAVVSQNDADVSIHLNDGDGTFTRNGADEAVGANPQHMTTADFNGDGYPDLAVVNNNDNDVSIHLNDGDGTFTRNGADEAVGALPQDIATADFNGDGYPDLAVVNWSDNDVSILLNDGDGTFTRNGSDEAVGAGPRHIATADFNGDGYPDLAVVNLSDNDVSILINDGDGTFTRNASDEAVGATPQDITTADFNADGYIDFAVANQTNNDVSVHLNDGDGTFTKNASDIAVGANPLGITTADFNADGYPDLAVTNFSDNDVSVLLNDRDGTFTRNGTDIAVGTFPDKIIAADFDQDGYPDLAVVNGIIDNDVSILINDTQTTFTGRLLDLTSNSSNTALRTLVQLTNDNTGATGTTALTIQQDGGGTAIVITGASILHAIDASENNITNALNVGANTIVGTTAVIDFTDFDVSNIGSITAQNSSAVHIFGAAASFEIVNGTAPTVDVAGEIAIDTNTDNSNITHGSIIFYDGTGLRYVPSVSTLPSTDNDVLVYDSASNSFLFEAQSGGGSLDAAYNDSTATITVDAYDILFDLNDSTNDYGLVIDNNTSGVIAIGLEFTSGGGGVLTTALEVSASLITNAINVGANTILGTTAVINFNNFDVAGSGQITLSPSSALTTAIDVTDTDITNAIDIGTNILAISTGTIGSNAATVIDFLDFDVSADGLIVLAPDGGGDAITVTPSAAITDGLDVANSIITNAINVGANTIVGTTAVIDFTNFDVSSGGTTTTKSLVANVVALPGGNILVGHTVNSNYLNLNGGFGTGGLERLTSTGNLTNISAITAGHLALSTAGDSFTRGTDEAVGAGPIGITTADFNADGYPDLAVVNNTDADVSIHLNDGDGTFTRNASDEAVGANPQHMTTADFNGDGYPDLAVANFNDNDVSIHLNDGDGTFTRNASDIAVGAGARNIASADFNADGYPDLAVVNNTDDDVSILLNDGDGTFTRNASDEAVGAGPRHIAAADFNADGYIDLAVANFTNNDVSILINDKDGTFTKNASDEAVGANPVGITAADFNNDGYIDLAVVNSGNNDVSILINDGDGTFTKNASDEAVGGAAQDVIAADFNGDGYPDLAVTNNSDADVAILINDRDGTFTGNTDEAVGGSPRDIVAADFDQDGYIDLAVANSADSDVAILINDTQTTFTGRLLDVASNSSNTSQRTLIQITNDNTGATGTTALTIQQDGGGTAILVTGAGVLHALDASDSSITNALNVGSNTITGTTAVIDFTNFDVSAAGQVTIGSFGGATATTVCENSGLLSACSSSIRYKEEVLDLTAGLDIIQQLRPVSFNWIGRDERDLGFIAEEVAAIYPLLITYVDEQIEGVKYGQLSAILVNAINEQQAEIIALADLVGVNLSALTIENAETEEVLRAESLLSRVDSLGARLTSLEEQGLVAGETTDNDAAGSDESLPYPQGFVATQPTTPDDLPLNEIFWQDIAITGLLTVENNAEILGELTVRSDVTLYAQLIVDTINIANALFVHGDTTLFGDLLVEGDVEVTGALSRSNEQVGEVTIPEGQQWAQISFNQSFLGVPTVNVTSDDSTVSYTVSDVTAAGFTVTLTVEEPGKDTQFSWYALVAPEDGSTVEYGGEFETDEVPTDDSEETNTTAEGESTPETGSDDVVQVDIEEIIIDDLPGLEIILGG